WKRRAFPYTETSAFKGPGSAAVTVETLGRPGHRYPTARHRAPVGNVRCRGAGSGSAERRATSVRGNLLRHRRARHHRSLAGRQPEETDIRMEPWVAL